MPPEISDARTHNFFGQDEVLFDANIWLYLEGPPGQRAELANAYSLVLENILVRDAALVMSPFVLSEFVNRYLRINYDTWTDRRLYSFKEYRSREAYRAVAAEVALASKRILDRCQRVVRGTSSIDTLKQDVSAMAGELSHDFNDLLLARSCREEGLILVTHDADASRYDGIVVVTANKRALGA